MDPEAKNLLEANLELSKENNRILRKLKRYHTRSTMFTVVKFLVIIGLMFGAYYYVSPYVNKLSEFLPILQQLDDLGKNLSGGNVGELLK